ncbi:hypothetical protein [Bradyrhizobium sp. SZCCHNR1015]|uniref:hypothetical protein n=1 Tax=Bradyrhizobium sp. SZCCHNR1015 TaxID=3057338 RepID=UPI00396768F2
MSGDRREADGGIIARRRGGFQRHAPPALNRLLVVLLEQDDADQAGDSVRVGEDADRFSSSLGFVVEAFELIGRV